MDDSPCFYFSVLEWPAWTLYFSKLQKILLVGREALCGAEMLVSERVDQSRCARMDW